MIHYDKLLVLLNERGINKAYLREHGVNPSQLNRLLKEGKSIGIDNRICSILNCQPGDFLEFTPDDDHTIGNEE